MYLCRTSGVCVSAGDIHVCRLDMQLLIHGYVINLYRGNQAGMESGFLSFFWLTSLVFLEYAAFRP